MQEYAESFFFLSTFWAYRRSPFVTTRPLAGRTIITTTHNGLTIALRYNITQDPSLAVEFKSKILLNILQFFYLQNFKYTRIYINGLKTLL